MSWRDLGGVKIGFYTLAKRCRIRNETTHNYIELNVFRLRNTVSSHVYRLFADAICIGYANRC